MSEMLGPRTSSEPLSGEPNLVVVIDVGRGGQHSAVCGGRGDASRVHQRDGSYLTLAGLGAFAVFEVAGCVPYRKTVVLRHVARAETGSAERSLDDGARLGKLGQNAFCGEIGVNRLRSAIYAEVQSVADTSRFQYSRRRENVVVSAARATRYDRLVDDHSAL